MELMTNLKEGDNKHMINIAIVGPGTLKTREGGVFHNPNRAIVKLPVQKGFRVGAKGIIENG